VSKSKIHPEDARQVIDAILNENANVLMKIIAEMAELAIENGDEGAAWALFAQQPDGSWDLSPQGEALLDLGFECVLQKAFYLIKRKYEERMAKQEAEEKKHEEAVN
jgi:hypothetical protein